MAKELPDGSSDSGIRDGAMERRPQPDHGNVPVVDSTSVSRNAVTSSRSVVTGSRNDAIISGNPTIASVNSSNQREGKTILGGQELDDGGLVQPLVTARNITSNEPDGNPAVYDESDDEDVALPLVVALNCLEDCHLEAEALAGVAIVEHVSLSHVSQGKIGAAAAVLLQTLAFLPRKAQQCLHAWQLLLCLGSVDKGVDSAVASDLGLQLVHVDTSRADEVADTTMALMLGLLRRTHVQNSHGFGSANFLGTRQVALKGMRRCKDLVLGIVGVSSSAYALASRCLAFKMQVIYFDTDEERSSIVQRTFPSAVKRVSTLKELLVLSDVISLHCPLTNDTVQIINSESLRHAKEGALLINTSSCHLLDDTAVKQALIDGTISGFALDGVEGPQWAEAWIREMPNVTLLPRSADYSDEVWTEIRAKAVVVLRSFFIDNFIPLADLSEEDNDWDSPFADEKQETFEKDSTGRERDDDQQYADSQTSTEFKHKQMYVQSDGRGNLHGGISNAGAHQEGRSIYAKSGRRGRKRSGRRKPHQSTDDISIPEREDHLRRGDHTTNVSGRDQLAMMSRFTSPFDVKCEKEGGVPTRGSISESQGSVEPIKSDLAIDQLKDGLIIALRTAGDAGYYVARQRGSGRGWFLDTRLDVTYRDPSAQFLVVLRHRDQIGLRSLGAGGKLLQANKKLEVGFVNHTFDMWESWLLQGKTLMDCRFTNSKYRRVTLDASIEILAIKNEEDGVVRWIA